jgi:tetratricopeptide (TPR) repeat protein
MKYDECLSDGTIDDKTRALAQLGRVDVYHLLGEGEEELLEASYEAADALRALGEEGRGDLSDLLYDIAQICEPGERLEVLEEALALREGLEPEGSDDLGRLQAELAEELIRTHSDEQAAELLLKAIANFAEHMPEEVYNRAMALQDLGAARINLGDLQGAMEAAQEAASLLEEGFRAGEAQLEQGAEEDEEDGPEPIAAEMVAEAIHKIGCVHMVMGNPAEAKKAFKAAIAFYDEFLGEEGDGDPETRALIKGDLDGNNAYEGELRGYDAWRKN